MTKNITIPKLGVNVTKFRLVEWKSEEGDRVEKGQIVLIVETEKTTWEIEAEASGFLHRLSVEGAKVPTNKVVGIIAETGQEYKKTVRDFPSNIVSHEVKNSDFASASSSANSVAETSKHRGADQQAVRISPIARKIAKEHDIEITRVTGVGTGGRKTRLDTERAIAKRLQKPLSSGQLNGRSNRRRPA